MKMKRRTNTEEAVCDSHIEVEISDQTETLLFLEVYKPSVVLGHHQSW